MKAPRCRPLLDLQDLGLSLLVLALLHFYFLAEVSLEFEVSGLEMGVFFFQIADCHVPFIQL